MSAWDAEYRARLDGEQRIFAEIARQSARDAQALRSAPGRAPLATAAVSFARCMLWVVIFCSGMLAAGPPHHTWAWLALVPFCWHFWRFLRHLSRGLWAA